MHADDLSIRRAEIIEHMRDRLEQLQRCAPHRDTPITTLTYAQSIDGCVAPRGGGALQLSNPESLTLTHQIRALHDAILVGVNTVLSDNPRLTVRLVEGKNPQPIVVDSRLRFPLDANLLTDSCVSPIIAAGHDACDRNEARLVAAGARVIRVPVRADGLIDLSQLMIQLKRLRVHSVMVEGGARIISSVLAARLADQLLLTIAPRFVDGLRAVEGLNCDERRPMPQLSNIHCQSLAGDLILRGDLERADCSLRETKVKGD